jgi:CubicO group peptidase (beta-lactamase class C family)
VAQEGRDPLEGFAPQVEQTRQAWQVPGLAVAVVHDGATVFAEGFGVREHGTAEPVTAETLFSIGSTTKAFTAAALALLEEEGKIAWDAPVIDYLPHFRVADPYVTRELTVRDLLTHRSGVEATDMLWVAGFDRDEIVRRLRHAEQSSSLRSRWEYNNSMYVVAGAVIEAVSGQSWERFVTERLLKPLGMETTMMVSTGIEERPNFAAAHAIREGEVAVLPYPHIEAAGPAGSMQSSVMEMARWIAFLLGEGRGVEAALLEPDTVAEFFRPQMLLDEPAYPAATEAAPHFFAYGLAWFLQDYQGRKVVMHTGSIWGMSALVGLLPEEEVGVVILANLDHAEVRHALMYTVFDRFLGKPTKDWSADLRELYQRPPEAAGQGGGDDRPGGGSPALPLDGYAGRYQHPLYGDLLLTLEDATLTLQWDTPQQRIADLEHQHHDVFFAAFRDRRFGRLPLQFRLGPGGEVEALEIVGFKTFRRLPPQAP